MVRSGRFCQISSIFVRDTTNLMIGLTGNYEVKVDSKGRVRLPANLLQQLPEDMRNGGFVMNKGMMNCLRLYPKKQWDAVTLEMNRLSYYRKDESNFLPYFYQWASTVEKDTNERILIPKRLLEKVGIKEDVTITAWHDVIEIWDTATYNASIVEPENFADMADEVWSRINNAKS